MTLLINHREFSIKMTHYLSQRGLHIILRKWQQLLSYLLKKNKIRYKKLINQLGIWESQIR